MAEGGEGPKEAPVWDRPTRIFHWVLVLLVVVCYLSGRNGRFDIHIPAGQALLVLVAARILWGFAGSASSRFRSFVRPVREIAAYLPTMLRREPDGRAGHNPLGGLSVVAMLLVLAVQASLGLFAVDVDGLNDGPLNFLVSYDAAREAAARVEVPDGVLGQIVNGMGVALFTTLVGAILGGLWLQIHYQMLVRAVGGLVVDIVERADIEVIPEIIRSSGTDPLATAAAE